MYDFSLYFYSCILFKFQFLLVAVYTGNVNLYELLQLFLIEMHLNLSLYLNILVTHLILDICERNKIKYNTDLI